MHAEPLEQAVWDAVVEAMQHPEVLIAEHEKRLEDVGSIDALDAERKQLELALKRVKLQEYRVTSAYINEVMELDRYGVEMDKLKGRRERLEKTLDGTALQAATGDRGQVCGCTAGAVLPPSVSGSRRYGL